MLTTQPAHAAAAASARSRSVFPIMTRERAGAVASFLRRFLGGGGGLVDAEVRSDLLPLLVPRGLLVRLDELRLVVGPLLLQLRERRVRGDAHDAREVAAVDGVGVHLAVASGPELHVELRLEVVDV